MNFVIGDKVIPILDRVTLEDEASGLYDVSMEHFFEKEHTILDKDEKGRYTTVEGGEWVFAEHWLEHVGKVYYFAQTESFFDKAYASLARMQNEKNKRYGESALNPLDIFAKHHPYGSRLDEKLARVKNSDVLRKNDLADIVGGIMLICKDKGFDNFDDLID